MRNRPLIDVDDVDAALREPKGKHHLPPSRSPDTGGRGGRHPASGEGGGSDASDWSDPVPLREPAPPPFPLEQLHPIEAQRFVGAVAQTYAVPADLPGLSWLALAGGCLTYAHHRVGVRVQPDWLEPLNSYAVVALPSGARKSQVLSALLAPVQPFEADLIRNTRGAVAQQRSRLTTMREALKRLEGKAAGGDEDARLEALNLAEQLATEDDPVSPRLLVDDATPERLVSLLAEQRGKLIMASAECDVIGMMRGRYAGKADPNLGVYLKAHCGELLLVDRVGRLQDRVEHPALTVLISAQPEELAKMISDRTLRARGVVNRFAYAVPPSPLGSRPLKTLPIPDGVRAAYHGLMGRLLECEGRPPRPPQWEPDAESGGHGGQDRPRWLGIAPDAEDVLLDFRADVERSQAPGGEFEVMSGWASKLPGLVCRWAGCMSLASDPDCEIVSGESLEAAVTIGRWQWQHARCAFGQAGADPDTAGAALVLSWLERTGPRTFTKRDAWQALKGSNHTTIAQAADLDAPLRVLSDHGYIMRIDEEVGNRRGPKSETYATHPSLRGR